MLDTAANGRAEGGSEVGMSEFDKVDACVNCKIRDFCAQYPDDQYTCEDVMVMAGVLKPEPPKEEERDILGRR